MTITATLESGRKISASVRRALLIGLVTAAHLVPAGIGGQDRQESAAPRYLRRWRSLATYRDPHRASRHRGAAADRPGRDDDQGAHRARARSLWGGDDRPRGQRVQRQLADGCVGAGSRVLWSDARVGPAYSINISAAVLLALPWREWWSNYHGVGRMRAWRAACGSLDLEREHFRRARPWRVCSCGSGQERPRVSEASYPVSLQLLI
jgi:hypothetical protein